VNLLFNLKVGPFALVDLSPFAFTVTAGVLVFGVFRFGLLDQRPMARSQIFETIGDPVFVLDPYGRVIDANPAAGRLLKRPVAALIGRTAVRLIPELGDRAVGQVTASEITLAGRTYDLAISPLPGRPGRRGLDELKGAFLQAVSHDLRTPLASVLGIAVTLEQKHWALPRAEVDDLLGRLTTNARRLDRILSGLLDLDRLARGVVEPRRERTDLAELVATVIEQARADMVGDHPVFVDLEPVEIAVDSAKVERIVENLLVNASRHTPPGTPIWVSVDHSDGGALLTVADAGPGVPADQREHIFQPFHRGPGVDGHAPGSGVGLALVARFAGLHGGRAWVEPRAGGGASFQVLLPDSPEAVPPPEPVQSAKG
jgi:signal transduction histidine kinase